jgi:hypothetical protein
MHPTLKIFIKLLAIIFMLIVVVQINNFYCLNFNKCRPFYLSFYYNKFKTRKYENVKIITNYSIINLNNDVEVTIDFDKTTSKIGEIAKVNLMLKNLTNLETSVQNNFTTNEKIFENFMTLLQCPCSRTIILKPMETKMITIEFFYHILVNATTMENLGKTLSNNGNLSYQDNGKTFILNNMQITIKK